jgi:hypothetical protein
MSESKKALVKSAKSRAWRSLVQGLSFDVGAASVLVLYTAISKANGWGDLEWALIGFTLFKSVSVSAFAYLMRRVFTEQFPPVE